MFLSELGGMVILEDGRSIIVREDSVKEAMGANRGDVIRVTGVHLIRGREGIAVDGFAVEVVHRCDHVLSEPVTTDEPIPHVEFSGPWDVRTCQVCGWTEYTYRPQ
jgi:hypothetical protein